MVGMEWIFYLDEYCDLSLVIPICTCFPTTKYSHQQLHNYKTSCLITELEHLFIYYIDGIPYIKWWYNVSHEHAYMYIYIN